MLVVVGRCRFVDSGPRLVEVVPYLGTYGSNSGRNRLSSASFFQNLIGFAQTWDMSTGVGPCWKKTACIPKVGTTLALKRWWISLPRVWPQQRSTHASLTKVEPSLRARPAEVASVASCACVHGRRKKCADPRPAPERARPLRGARLWVATTPGPSMVWGASSPTANGPASARKSLPELSRLQPAAVHNARSRMPMLG